MYLQACVGGSPEYIVGEKLGKGGFGQVKIGKRVGSSSTSTAPQVRIFATTHWYQALIVRSTFRMRADFAIA